MSRAQAPAVDAAVYASRRERYMDALGPSACALVRSPPEAVRNGDVHHPYRHSSDLYYLTGFTEPGATLVLRPGADKDRVVLFVRPRDPALEQWNGRRAGVEGAVERYGADVAYPVSELRRRLPELVANCEALHYSLGLDANFDRVVANTIAGLRRSERKGQRPPRMIVDPRTVLHELRLRKAPEELALLRRAADITVEAMTAAMREARPGMGEHELEALVHYVFRRNGGDGPGYGTIVGAGDNATILHYTDNDHLLDADELVLIDAGCEYQSYTADITRTFPVSGRFSPPQRRCYELVLAVQKAAVAMVRPGVTVDDVQAHVVRGLSAAMVELGLCEGPVEACIEDERYKRFYPHRSSHWLGLDVHDAGDYTRDGAPRPLEPGMVVTVEPGLYIPADAEGVPAEYRGIGIRIEDDVLVTADGHDNLTAAAPKEIADIEAACAGGNAPPRAP